MDHSVAGLVQEAQRRGRADPERAGKRRGRARAEAAKRGQQTIPGRIESWSHRCFDEIQKAGL